MTLGKKRMPMTKDEVIENCKKIAELPTPLLIKWIKEASK